MRGFQHGANSHAKFMLKALLRFGNFVCKLQREWSKDRTRSDFHVRGCRVRLEEKDVKFGSRCLVVNIFLRVRYIPTHHAHDLATMLAGKRGQLRYDSQRLRGGYKRGYPWEKIE